MPRGPRIKTPDSVFHVMVRSIEEIKMFKKESDKDFYFYLIRKYKQKYNFKVYAYCLMDNHGHLIIDANGADISKIMHGINFTFAQYFNKNNHRRGTLFQDRFKSKIVKNDNYIITLSAYIHNNPRAIADYNSCPEKYNYSSLAVYLGFKKDPHNILDSEFILQMFGRNNSFARKNYFRFMKICNDCLINEEIEFTNDKSEYRSGRKILIRDLTPNEIIEFVSNLTNINSDKIHIKNNKSMTEARSLCALLMKNLCNFKCKEICEILGNITIGRVSKLCDIGINIIDENLLYKNVISEFITKFAN